MKTDLKHHFPHVRLLPALWRWVFAFILRRWALRLSKASTGSIPRAVGAAKDRPNNRSYKFEAFRLPLHNGRYVSYGYQLCDRVTTATARKPGTCLPCQRTGCQRCMSGALCTQNTGPLVWFSPVPYPGICCNHLALFAQDLFLHGDIQIQLHTEVLVFLVQQLSCLSEKLRAGPEGGYKEGQGSHRQTWRVLLC